ncbi:CoA-binding protein [Rhodohalobacter halophilus]|uniref:CoA-binding protein n=1 Tax=Rhodohalobacter halophilus TaxID=1812810 RepID=UPI001C402CB1|nr:CoA-binding protein [Rhodohalobacter halophilus]
MKSTFNNWYETKMRATPELSDETDRIEQHLDRIRTVAIVGLSRNRHKDSHFVGRYLQKAGYTIYPVNPGADEILGVKAYPDLKSIPEAVDAVDIFVKPESVPAVVEASIAIRPNIIWLQLGTGNHPDQKAIAEQNGITLVQNRCMKVDHQFLIRDRDNV